MLKFKTYYNLTLTKKNKCVKKVFTKNNNFSTFIFATFSISIFALTMLNILININLQKISKLIL